MFLGAIWEHNDLRVGQINSCIRTEVEQHLGKFGSDGKRFDLRRFRPTTGVKGIRGLQQNRNIP